MNRKILSLIAAIGLTLGNASQVIAMDDHEIIDKAAYFEARAARLKEQEQMEAQYFKRRSAYIGDNKAFQKFVDVYSPPAPLLSTLIRNEKEIYDRPLFHYRSDQIIAKGSREAVGRIILANRMRNYIQQKNFKFASAPQKYIFLAGDQWILIAQKIKRAQSPSPINLERIQELTDIATEFNFKDLHSAMVRTDLTFNNSQFYCAL